MVRFALFFLLLPLLLGAAPEDETALELTGVPALDAARAKGDEPYELWGHRLTVQLPQPVRPEQFAWDGRQDSLRVKFREVQRLAEGRHREVVQTFEKNLKTKIHSQCRSIALQRIDDDRWVWVVGYEVWIDEEDIGFRTRIKFQPWICEVVVLMDGTVPEIKIETDAVELAQCLEKPLSLLRRLKLKEKSSAKPLDAILFVEQFGDGLNRVGPQMTLSGIRERSRWRADQAAPPLGIDRIIAKADTYAPYMVWRSVWHDKNHLPKHELERATLYHVKDDVWVWVVRFVTTHEYISNGETGRYFTPHAVVVLLNGDVIEDPDTDEQITYDEYYVWGLEQITEKTLSEIRYKSRWDARQPNPPLSARDALQHSRTYVKRIEQRLNKAYGVTFVSECKSINLVQKQYDVWIWRVNYEIWPEKHPRAGELENDIYMCRLGVFVLMNGDVLEYDEASLDEDDVNHIKRFSEFFAGRTNDQQAPRERASQDRNYQIPDEEEDEGGAGWELQTKFSLSEVRDRTLWRRDQPNPPLAARDVITKAEIYAGVCARRRNAKTPGTDGDVEFEFRELQLRHLDGDNWVWVAQFDSNYLNIGLSGPQPQDDVVILMNGDIITHLRPKDAE